jgi:hypothetical protein
MAKSGVRDALKRINEILYDYDDISVDVAMHGGRITITADLGKQGTRSYSARTPAMEEGAEAPKRRGRKPGRPAKRGRGESGSLPTSDELLAAITASKSMTMTRLSKKLGVKPRQRLAPIILGLIREGKVRKSGVNLVSSVPGEAKRGPGRPPGSGEKKKVATKAARGSRKATKKAASEKPAGRKAAGKKGGARKVGRPAKKAMAGKKAAKRGGRRGKKSGGTPPVEIPGPASEASGSKES